MTWYPDRREMTNIMDVYDDPRTVDGLEPCPECELGVIYSTGPMEWDTGHYPLGCSERCGWTN